MKKNKAVKEFLAAAGAKKGEKLSMVGGTVEPVRELEFDESEVNGEKWNKVMSYAEKVRPYDDKSSDDVLARFDAEFKNGKGDTWYDTLPAPSRIKSFLLKEIERALTEQRRVIFQRYRQIGDPDTANSILAERFESGITAERERILALIEEMQSHYANYNVSSYRCLLELGVAINNPNTQ